ncbi:hypothetical protein PINS_up008417 [Pythium insidiosum]|nr:hypothetical protein PINS_up008417 [Pythium insidiosum]
MLLLLWTALLLALGRAAASYSYLHDGLTTYCWEIPQPSNRTLLTEADRVDAATECPLSVSISVTSATISVSQALNVSWTVAANRTLAVGADDNSTGAEWSGQILEANVQMCVFGTECDPFDSGDGFVAHTGSVVANVTQGQTTFRATLSFPEAGEYSVLAHVVAAVENSSRRVDFGVYPRVNVLPAQIDETKAGNISTTELTKAPSPTASGTSILLSKGTIIGLLAGVSVALLLSIIAILRTRRTYQDSDPRAFHQCQPTPAASNLRVDAGRTSHASTMPPTSPAGPRPRPRPRKQRSSTQALPSKTEAAPSVAAVPGASPVDDRYALQRAESDLEL